LNPREGWSFEQRFFQREFILARVSGLSHRASHQREPLSRRSQPLRFVVLLKNHRKRIRMRLIASSTAHGLYRSIAILSRAIFASVVLIAGAMSFADAQTPPVPAGWRASTAGPNATYQPENLPAGKSFVLTIPPPQSLGGQTLASWFTAQVLADLQHRGAQAQIGNPQSNPDGTLLLLVPYTDHGGQSWIAVYAAAAGPNGAQFCSMISNLPPQEMKTYIRSGATIFGETVKQASEHTSPSSSTDRSQSASSAAPGHSGGSTPMAAPPSGDLHVPIAGIFHEGRGMTTATGYQYVESVDLLLTDGWEYSGLTRPSEDLNVEASKQSEPQKWHHWRQQGGTYYLEVNGRWTKLDGDLVRPLESGSSLRRNLVHRNAQTFVGMGGTIGTDRISFYPDGHFERSANVLAGSGTVQASGGFSAGASSATGRNGTSSSSSGTYSGSSGSVTARSNRSTTAGAGAATGKYKVSGYTLELDCADGQVQRFLAFYPFPGKPQIFIANVTFSVE
jgi:hypothetical protein